MYYICIAKLSALVNCSNSDTVILDCFVRASTEPQNRISKRAGGGVFSAGLLPVK